VNFSGTLSLVLAVKAPDAADLRVGAPASLFVDQKFCLQRSESRRTTEKHSRSSGAD
jgi:hypothetical protein